ncbi:hypothetical protein IEQ34_008577 [Dendrobium chrysotoxum]|uniref:Aminotransferase-like plant mobile domain-containing protein n=1 Tax=Dendrobium chrysotoxum TaxID=161865 RepID=A0AAV7GYB7_DENCH|nr:hypothetical protein IEQ34_008577 [Dendrobium chrysotoxum]
MGSDEQPSIILLGDAHRSSNLDEIIHALLIVGINSIIHLHFIRLDHSMHAELVERWCPMTNTFHLPIGEITVTLQGGQFLFLAMANGKSSRYPIGSFSKHPVDPYFTEAMNKEEYHHYTAVKITPSKIINQEVLNFQGQRSHLNSQNDSQKSSSPMRKPPDQEKNCLTP